MLEKFIKVAIIFPVNAKMCQWRDRKIFRRGAGHMKQVQYEIWIHEENQTWKIFTNVTEELRALLEQTGWSPVIQPDKHEE